MTSYEPKMDASFREYADLQLRRHRFLMGGEERSDEMEEIEDRLGELWEALDDVQRRSVNGMGSDLNWVRRGLASAPKGRNPDEVTQAQRDELAKALTDGRWHDALHLLRVCGPAMNVEELVRCRATAYSALGLVGMAEPFSSVATQGRLMPDSVP